MLRPLFALFLVTSFFLSFASAADLTARLDSLLSSVPKGGLAGVAVIAVADQSVLYRHEADQPLILASTTKVLVAGAALLHFGTDYRLSTRLVALGPLTEGVLPGLGIIGGGDPTIDNHFAEGGDPDQILMEWVATLKKTGVQRIQGDLIIDGRLFSGPIRPDTYPTDGNNAQEWFSAPASAFALNDNCIEARAIPNEPGEAATIILRPSSPRISLRNLTRSVSGKQATNVVVNRDRDSNRLTFNGNCGKALGWLKPVAIHSDPDLLAGDHLKRFLVHQGILVSGDVRRGDVASDARTLVERRQELVPALEVMLKRSQNFYSEQILRLIGQAHGKEGSVAVGTRAVMEILRSHLGEAAPAVNLLDGSGLSYGNTASALGMTRFLSAMTRTPVGAVFLRSLKDKDVGTVRGKVKTGTLAAACTLAGYLDAPSGKRWAFAILCNRGSAANLAWAPKLRDRVLEEIARAMR